MARPVKRAFKYRFHPTPEQAAELARTFGCVRLVYNKALAERTRAYTQEHRRMSYVETSAMLTGWKRTEELGFLSQVSRLCSACGAPQEAMPLHVRTWQCGCGAVHDRDVNAARNILAAGLAER